MKDSKRDRLVFERYKKVTDLLKEENDKKGLRLVQELINECTDYINYLVNYERIMGLQRFRAQSDSEELSKFVKLEGARADKHEILIGKFKETNIYLIRDSKIKNQVPKGGICSLEPEKVLGGDRSIIGWWAEIITKQLLQRGILKK